MPETIDPCFDDLINDLREIAAGITGPVLVPSANATDYQRFRGRCKEMSEVEVRRDPDLRLVRGYYTCPIWNRREEHWWCVRKDGTVVDPTAKQFPSAGIGTYEEFDGTVACAQCGKVVLEKDVVECGRYPVCSGTCACRLVGI